MKLLRLKTTTFIFLIILLFISCEKQNDEKKEIIRKPSITMTQNTTFSAGEISIKIDNPWVKPSRENRNTPFYFEAGNTLNLPDTLLSAESDVARVVEIHETVKKSDNKIRTKQVGFVEIPAKETVEFQPASFHIMLVGLNKNISLGDTVEVNLNFSIAGKIPCEAIVRNITPANIN